MYPWCLAVDRVTSSWKPRLIDDGSQNESSRNHVQPLVLAKLDHRSRISAKGRDLSFVIRKKEKRGKKEEGKKRYFSLESAETAPARDIKRLRIYARINFTPPSSWRRTIPRNFCVWLPYVFFLNLNNYLLIMDLTFEYFFTKKKVLSIITLLFLSNLFSVKMIFSRRKLYFLEILFYIRE